jgi:hypothetical protein
MFIYVLPLEIQLSRGGWMVEIPLTGLTLPYLFACPKPGPVFPASYIVVFVYVQ